MMRRGGFLSQAIVRILVSLKTLIIGLGWQVRIISLLDW